MRGKRNINTGRSWLPYTCTFIFYFLCWQFRSSVIQTAITDQRKHRLQHTQWECDIILIVAPLNLYHVHTSLGSFKGTQKASISSEICVLIKTLQGFKNVLWIQVQVCEGHRRAAAWQTPPLSVWLAGCLSWPLSVCLSLTMTHFPRSEAGEPRQVARSGPQPANDVT